MSKSKSMNKYVEFKDVQTIKQKPIVDALSNGSLVWGHLLT